MKFIPLYFKDKLNILNPDGDVAIITLWTRPQYVIQKIKSNRIVVVANLYGNGFQQMLRNLLYNPQIKYLIILGQDLSGSKSDVINFFEHGIEEFEYLGSKTFRIKNTNRIVDNLVTPQTFINGIKLAVFGTLEKDEQSIIKYINSLPSSSQCDLERIKIEIPKIEVKQFPSDIRSHSVTTNTPLEAWQELVAKILRFGVHSQLKKEKIIQIQNVKVVVNNPINENASNLAKFGFSLEVYKEYQKRILSSDLAGQAYTYGHRITKHFNCNSLLEISKRLKENPETRHAYISLWDGFKDVKSSHVPCLVSLYLNIFEGKLFLTSTFRSHSIMDAWLQNFHGLIAIHEFVSNYVKIERGSITVFSQSALIDYGSLAKAKTMVENLKYKMKIDPNGNFEISFDQKTNEIVAKQFNDGIEICEYRGKTPELLERELARNFAISDVSHAMYIGREIQKCYFNSC